MGNVIIPEFITEPASSYQIQVQGSVKTDVVVRRAVSRIEVVQALTKHFENSIQYLQSRKEQIFRSNGNN